MTNMKKIPEVPNLEAILEEHMANMQKIPEFSNTDTYTIFDMQLKDITFENADANRIDHFEFALSFGYEINVEVQKSNDQDFPYSVTIDLFNEKAQIIATKQNTCLDPCNLSDQLFELTNELVDKGLINIHASELESNKFTVILENAPDPKYVQLASVDATHFSSTKAKIINVSLKSFYNSLDGEGFTAEFTIETESNTTSELLEGTIEIDFLGFKVSGKNLDIEPAIYVID